MKFQKMGILACGKCFSDTSWNVKSRTEIVKGKKGVPRKAGHMAVVRVQRTQTQTVGGLTSKVTELTPLVGKYKVLLRIGK
jgi:hypothetical protein